MSLLNYKIGFKDSAFIAIIIIFPKKDAFQGQKSQEASFKIFALSGEWTDK